MSIHSAYTLMLRVREGLRSTTSSFEPPEIVRAAQETVAQSMIDQVKADLASVKRAFADFGVEHEPGECAARAERESDAESAESVFAGLAYDVGSPDDEDDEDDDA